eukprot:GHVU01147350.1.p1 GENE.GHVU01147350.1~~GHVU01147350.1.p1  ORF type:complete len:154 (-),score=6.37 GHVU01147350.1:346-807(-)
MLHHYHQHRRRRSRPLRSTFQPSRWLGDDGLDGLTWLGVKQCEFRYADSPTAAVAAAVSVARARGSVWAVGVFASRVEAVASDPWGYESDCSLARPPIHSFTDAHTIALRVPSYHTSTRRRHSSTHHRHHSTERIERLLRHPAGEAAAAIQEA